MNKLWRLQKSPLTELLRHLYNETVLADCRARFLHNKGNLLVAPSHFALLIQRRVSKLKTFFF